MVYLAKSLDSTFGALADPTRREILARLARRDETIKQLAGRFDMSLPAVSKHLRVLERAGLVRIRLEGRTRQTALVAAPMRQAAGWIEQYRSFWDHQFDKLAHYLDATSADADTWTPPPRLSKSAAPSMPVASASSRRGRKQASSNGGRRRAQ